MPDVFDELSSGSGYKPTGDVFDSLPDSSQAPATPAQASPSPVQNPVHPLLADLPQPHDAAANADLNAQQFVGKLESVGRQMQADAIPPALRTAEPTISAPAHPFLSRLREAVTGPDSALGSIDGNKTTKPLINLQDLIPPGSSPVTNAAQGLAEGVSGFTTPTNLATIPLIGTFGKVGGPVVSRLVAGGFSLQALKGLWDSIPEFKQAVSSGNTDEAWRLAGRATADAGMAAWMGREAIRGEGSGSETRPPEQASPATNTTPGAGDVFDKLPDEPAEKSDSQPIGDAAASASNPVEKAGTTAPDVFDRLTQQPAAKATGDIFDRAAQSNPTPEQAAEAPTIALSDNQTAPMRLGSDTLSATDAAHRMVSDLSDESLGVASADGASQRLQQLSDDDLLRVKQAAEDRSNTAASQAVDDELASRHQDDSGINPRRVVFVGDGYQLRGAEDLGTFSTERDAFNAMKAEAAGQPFKGPVIDLAKASTEGESPVENTQPVKQLPAPETATEQPAAGATAEESQPGATATGDEQRTAPVLGPKPDDGRPPSSVQLNSMLGGFSEPLKRFAEDDVAPKLKEAASAVSDAKDDIQRVLAPGTRDISGKRAADAIRGNLAETVRKYDQAESALRTARKYFQSPAPADNYSFIDRIEQGAKQPTPEEQSMADTFRKMLDDRRKEVQALGKGKLEDFYENYFPHIWSDPEKAGNVFGQMLGRRPLEGPKSFLKQRTHLTFADGLQAGLKPVSDNPVDLALLKAREMDRYIMAHRTLAQLKDEGLAKFVPIGGEVPAGWTRINDPIGTTYSRGENGELILRGNHYAPDGAAQVLNNYLSPGLRSKGWYKVLLSANNIFNQAQLGLSAFHLGFTSVDAATSRAALGFEQMLRGRPITGVKTLVSAPAAPFTTAFKGNTLLKEWYRPGSQGGEIAQIADELMHAGGRARMDSFYQTQMAEGLVKAWREGNVIGAALRLPMATIDALSRPLLEHLVPRQKLGVFLDMARFEMEQHGRRMQSGTAEGQSLEQMRENMRQAWDSVDNRMCQMTYSNLQINRMAKDLAMITTRSVGWNIGSLRELGGAATDVIRQPLNALRGDPVNLKRLTYAMALPLVTGTSGAIYQYLRTGQWPQELKDYFAPKTGELDADGRPLRVWMPTYVKDVFAYTDNPVRTLTNKSSPLINVIGQMIRNKDYYGTKIRNEDDPLVQQLLEETKFIGGEALPFGVKNYQQQTQEGQSAVTKAQNFIGITAAQKTLEQTKAEQLAAKLVQAQIPPGGRTQEQADRSQLQHQLMREIAQGKDVRPDARQALVDGKLTPRELVETLKNAKLSPLERSTQHLGAADMLKVYNVATPAEKQILRPQLIKKVYSASKTMPEMYFQPLLASTRAALQKGIQ